LDIGEILWFLSCCAFQERLMELNKISPMEANKTFNKLCSEWLYNDEKWCHGKESTIDNIKGYLCRKYFKEYSEELRKIENTIYSLNKEIKKII